MSLLSAIPDETTAQVLYIRDSRNMFVLSRISFRISIDNDCNMVALPLNV